MTDENTPPVLVDKAGLVAFVTLNRASSLHAMSTELLHALGDALAALRSDQGVSVVVLQGAGDKAFCAGADLKERQGMSIDDTRAFLVQFNAVTDALAASPQVAIAAINGVAFGGGLEIAMACDIRIAAEHARVGLPEVQLGIIPGAGGTQRLGRLCGLAVAKEMILTGSRITALRALEIGLVSVVLPAAKLREEATRLADEIATAGPLALAAAKRAIDDGWGLPMRNALAVEQACYETVLRSADRDEGLAAFAEKRKPVFKGK